MAGAIAGTAVFRCVHEARLQLVTMTINNHCNLHCPHCYLQYAGPTGLIGSHVVERVLSASASHVAIVGKEPLVDDTSRTKCAEITAKAHEAGKTVSIVTNGLGLALAPPALLQGLDSIDVSFDGGPATYQQYRGPSLKILERSLRLAAGAGARELNALHVLSNVTIQHVNDMVSIDSLADFRRIVFSLFINSENDGRMGVAASPLHSVFAALASSREFRDNRRTVLLVDVPLVSKLPVEEVMERIDEFGLREKAFVVASDPLFYGIVRVTYDGFVLPPLASVHPRHYMQLGDRVPHDSSVGGWSLDAAYQRLLAAAA